MTFSIRTLTRTIGAEITGIDLREPLADETVQQVMSAWSAYGVLVFRDQPLTDDQHVRFGRRFGRLEVFEGSEDTAAVPEIYLAGNTDRSGCLLPPESEKLIKLNWNWHTDSSYRPTPTRGAILHGIEVIEDGGDTMFANLAAAYETLPDDVKVRIAHAVAVHSFEFLVTSRELPPLAPEESARLPAACHPLVRQHRDGRRSLYLSPPYMAGIVGWVDDEARALIDTLASWATQARFVYRHRWRAHDLVMWDNEWTMHTVTPYDFSRSRRVMHGITILADSGQKQ